MYIPLYSSLTKYSYATIVLSKLVAFASIVKYVPFILLIVGENSCIVVSLLPILFPPLFVPPGVHSSFPVLVTFPKLLILNSYPSTFIIRS